MPKKKRQNKKTSKNKDNQFGDEFFNSYQDDRFCFIAGYTSGGAPYGTTWEELGLEPYEGMFNDMPEDEDSAGSCSGYNALSKREQDSIDSKLRESFTQYVRTHRRMPSKQARKTLVTEAFQASRSGPLEYTKEFNATYRKIVRKRENAFIQEGILPKRMPPTVKQNWFKQSVMLDCKRFSLRKITQNDFECLAGLLKDPAATKEWGYAFTDEQIQKFINNQQSRYQNDIVGYFAAVSKETSAFIGLMGLLWGDIGIVNALEVKCILKPEYTGNGYAGVGADELIKFAFEVIGLNKVFAVIQRDNANAVRLAGRIGMMEDNSIPLQDLGNERVVYSKSRGIDKK